MKDGAPMTAEEINRFTWSTLDRPTMAYVVELVFKIDPSAWAKLRYQLERLDQSGGHLPEWDSATSRVEIVN